MRICAPSHAFGAMNLSFFADLHRPRCPSGLSALSVALLCFCGKSFSSSCLFGVYFVISLLASSFSAISIIFRTLFQFLPVHCVFNTRSIAAHFIFGRAIPFGK